MWMLARRSIVVLCLAALLLAALTPGASSVLPAILVPLWFFVSIFVCSLLYSTVSPRIGREFPFLPILASRPPPVA